MNPNGTGKAFTVYTESTRAFQAIAAEIGDYSKRLLEDGTATMSQLATAKSPPDAFDVWAAFHKRMAKDYLQQMSKLAGMYSSVAKEQTAAFQAMVTPSPR